MRTKSTRRMLQKTRAFLSPQNALSILLRRQNACCNWGVLGLPFLRCTPGNSKPSWKGRWHSRDLGQAHGNGLLVAFKMYSNTFMVLGYDRLRDSDVNLQAQSLQFVQASMPSQTLVQPATSPSCPNSRRYPSENDHAVPEVAGKGQGLGKNQEQKAGVAEQLDKTPSTLSKT